MYYLLISDFDFVVIDESEKPFKTLSHQQYEYNLKADELFCNYNIVFAPIILSNVKKAVNIHIIKKRIKKLNKI